MYRYQKRAKVFRDIFRHVLYSKGVGKGTKNYTELENRLNQNCKLESNCKINSDCKLESNCKLNSDCKLESDCKINSDSRLVSDCKFESGISRKIKLENINRLRILILTTKSQNKKILIFLSSFSLWHGG